MNRRQALLGVVVAITALLGRRYTVKAGDNATWSDSHVLTWEPPKHQSIIFEAGYIDKIIIEREDKPDIEVLFSEIIEALEKV